MRKAPGCFPRESALTCGGSWVRSQQSCMALGRAWQRPPLPQGLGRVMAVNRKVRFWGTLLLLRWPCRCGQENELKASASTGSTFLAAR